MKQIYNIMPKENEFTRYTDNANTTNTASLLNIRKQGAHATRIQHGRTLGRRDTENKRK